MVANVAKIKRKICLQTETRSILIPFTSNLVAAIHKHFLKLFPINVPKERSKYHFMKSQICLIRFVTQPS